MRWAACLLAGGAVVLTGAAIASGRGWRSDPPVSRLFRAGVGLLAGLVCWGAAFLLVLFLRGVDARALIIKDAALAAIGGLLTLIFMRRGPRNERAVTSVATHIPGTDRVLMAALALCVAIAFVLHAIKKPDGDWDAWTIWNVRARFLYLTGSASQTFDSRLVHADYPPLLPALVAGGWFASGGEGLWVAPLVAGLFAATTAAVLAGCVSECRGGGAAFVAAAVLLGTPQFLQLAEKQYADVPLGALIAAACGLVALALERRAAPTGLLLPLAGAMASAAALLKNEGLLYFLAILGALILVPRGSYRHPRRLTEAACFVVGAAPLLILLAWFKLTLAPPNDLVRSVSSGVILTRLSDPSRCLLIVRALLARCARVGDWSVFLAGVPLALAWGLRHGASDAVRVVGAALLIVALGFGAVYLLTPFDVNWHINTSMDRLIIQLWPSVLLLTALQLGPRSEAPCGDTQTTSNRPRSSSGYSK